MAFMTPNPTWSNLSPVDPQPIFARKLSPSGLIKFLSPLTLQFINTYHPS